jgi:Nitroreductase family
MEFVTDAHRRRADAILLRRTDRLPFAAPARWELIEPLLRATVDNTSVRFDVLAEDARQQLVEASLLAESLRLYDSSYHAELDWWTAPFEMSDGVPRSSLVSAAESERVDVGRTFRVTGHGDRRAEVPEDHSKIVVLSTRGATREDALRCGEALSGVLLDATMLGLSTCTLTHITEVAASREIVAALIGQDTTPQVLVRVGEAPSLADLPPATPRRPLDDVLTVESGSP